MTNLSTSNQISERKNNAGYYAVDAKRVIQIFELFKMRPSHFSAGGKAGAQSVYYDARKIIEGRTNNKWGHHTARAINNFCHFTQSENGILLPWQELIEHRNFYDGKEGAGRRTGNLLQTENRLQLNHKAMISARQQCKLSQQQLAQKTALPLQFIEVMESGNWSTVAESTANIITDVLGVNKNTIFTQISGTTEADISDTPDRGTWPSSRTPTTNNHRIMNRVLLLVPVFGFVFWAGYQFYPLSKPSITIPITNPDDITRHQRDRPGHNNGDSLNTLTGCWNWSNGTHIAIDTNGTAHNGLIGATWKIIDITNRHYTITWPSFVDTLSLSADNDVLSGNNNYGLPVTATRKSGVTPGLVGSWLWGNGITMVIRPDATVTGGSLKGIWRKAGNNWVIEWPVVDSIILSANGRNLSAKNQFGAATARRDESCTGKR